MDPIFTGKTAGGLQAAAVTRRNASALAKVPINYLEAVRKTPSSQSWFHFLAGILPPHLSSLSRERVRTLIIETLCEDAPKHPFSGEKLSPADFQFAVVSFELDPSIEESIGRKVAVPRVVFNSEDTYRNFLFKVGQSEAVHALTIEVPFEKFLSRLGINVVQGTELRPLSIAVWHDKVPPKIMRHEEVHAIDPLLAIRGGGGEETDALLITEMAAALGESLFAPSETSSLASISFWLPYLERLGWISAALLKVLKVPDTLFGSLRIAKFWGGFGAGSLAGINPYFLAQVISKRAPEWVENYEKGTLFNIFISSTSFEEVYDKLQKSNPGYFSFPSCPAIILSDFLPYFFGETT